jgi:hypothetical protein
MLPAMRAPNTHSPAATITGKHMRFPRPEYLSPVPPVQALVSTQAKQKEAKRYEEVEAGKYKMHVTDPGALPAELEKAQQKQERVKAVVQALAQTELELQPQLQRVLVLAEAV